MKKLALITFCLLFLNSNGVVALDTVDLFNPKRTTPSTMLVDNMSKPAVFNRSNNLTRKPGSFNVAIGDPLYIKGVITDAFGVPVQGATVKIWQTNAAGKYHSLLDEYSQYVDPNFSMSGEAATDNLGRYGFLTIFPGYYEDRAPHVNFIISHDKFGTIETELYFEKHPRNKMDSYYLSYDNEAKDMLTARVEYINPDNPNEGKVAVFDITMEGIHQYKGF